MPDIESLLSSFQVHDYRVFTGFDEELIQAGIGFLEQIHIFLSSEPADINSLLSQLASLFSPFTAIVFTRTTQYRIPDDFDELAQTYAYAFIDDLHGRKSDFGYLTAIHLSQSPAASKTSNLGGGSNGQSSGENDLTKKGKEREAHDRDGDGDGDRDGDRDEDEDEDRDWDGDGDGDEDGDGDGDGDQDPDPQDGNRDVKWNAEVTFNVEAELLSSSDTRSKRFPFQILNTKGVFTIMVSFTFSRSLYHASLTSQ